MHDVHLAKAISDTIKDYSKKHKLKKINSVKLELGKISEHGEEISSQNLEFNLKNLDPSLKKVKIEILKSPNTDYWKLVSLDGEI